MIIPGAALYDDTMLSCNSFSQGSHWVREEQSVCSSHGMFRHLVHNTSSITSNVQVDQGTYSTTLVSAGIPWQLLVSLVPVHICWTFIRYKYMYLLSLESLCSLTPFAVIVRYTVIQENCLALGIFYWYIILCMCICIRFLVKLHSTLKCFKASHTFHMSLVCFMLRFTTNRTIKKIKPVLKFRIKTKDLLNNTYILCHLLDGRFV